MHDAIREAEALLALLEQGEKADPRVVFGLYYQVRSHDAGLADRILRDTTVYMGLYARNRRRLKELDKWLDGTAPFSYPTARSSSV